MQVNVPASDLDFRVYYTAPKFEDGTVIICHHGAGHSGLTFACMAKEITDMSKGECGVLAYDCRGHGRYNDVTQLSAWLTTHRIGKTKHLSSPENPAEENLDIEVLTADLVNLVQAVFPDPQAAPSLLVR